MRLALLIGCECHGEIPSGDPDVARVVALLVETMEKHPRFTVQLHAHSALLMGLSGCGKDLQAGLRHYPEAHDALTRWWENYSRRQS